MGGRKAAMLVGGMLALLAIALLAWPAAAEAIALERVSVSNAGVEGSGPADGPSISADGRYVAFVSNAHDLVTGDTNNHEDIFVYDRVTGEIERVSVDSAGNQADGFSSLPSISADGRYVAFQSYASNLVSGDTNNRPDVFVHDRQTGITVRASVSSDEVEADLGGDTSTISAGGRYVAFWSSSNTLIAGDSLGSPDVFVRDLQEGTTELVNIGYDGNPAHYPFSSGRPAISADGRCVAFWSQSDALVTGDTNSNWDVFVRDRVTGTTERVSVDSEENQTGWVSFAGSVAISADGNYVAFDSTADTLVASDANESSDIFVRDRAGGTTERVSLDNDGAEVQGGGTYCAISADGRYVAFVSQSDDLVPGDTNTDADVFIHDRQTATVQLLSVSEMLTLAAADCLEPSISADGTAVAFTSYADNLVPDDENGYTDVFVADVDWATTVLGVSPSAGPAEGGVSVVIHGTNFARVTAVTFGGTPATSFAVDSPFQITVTTPPHDIGLVQVQVTGGGGASDDTDADDFTYSLPPAITGLDPNHGPDPGGTSVTITGANFDGLSGPGSVTFGGKNALNYTVESSTEIVAVAPAHVVGTVQVQVTTPLGSTADTDADDYTYEPAPVSTFAAQERVSVDSSGIQGDSSSWYPAVSADGRYVAFLSDADNLVTGDTNACPDVFVRDRATGSTQRVNVSTAGAEAEDVSDGLAISADGRYVGFVSAAANLVTGDTNGAWDVFVHDRVTGTTERVSMSTEGIQANEDCTWVSLSADGRYVAFSSVASNLVPGDTNDWCDIFVRDRQQGTTERVSISNSGAQGNGWSDYVSISADGNYVAFDSAASTLVTGDNNGTWDVFVRDRAGGTTERVSLTASGGQANEMSSYPSISADGRYVVFESLAGNLVTGDTNWVFDVFVRDRTAATTTRVSVSTTGGQVSGDSGSASISGDGRYVAFESYASNLVVGDGNGTWDIFVRDLATRTTRRMSVAAGGTQANDESWAPAISADGRYLAFGSTASNLVSGDTGGWDDIFTVIVRTYSSLRGAHRYETAQMISRALFPGPLSPGGGCVVAPGETYPEALCGAPLAAAYGGPVLLTPTVGLENGTRTELERLRPETVFVIGLSTTIRDAVQSAVQAVVPTAQVVLIPGPENGQSVYEMSRAVANALKTKVNADGGDISQATAIVTIGTNFPDAIGVSPLACAKLWPILLTDQPDGSALHAEAAAALADLGITQAIKVGTYALLPGAVTGLTNCSGTDRYVTNAKVAAWAKSDAGLDFTHTGLATGDKFPDALASGPYLAADGGILLLSPLLGPVPTVIADVLKANVAAVERVSLIACIEPVIGQVMTIAP